MITNAIQLKRLSKHWLSTKQLCDLVKTNKWSNQNLKVNISTKISTKDILLHKSARYIISTYGNHAEVVINVNTQQGEKLILLLKYECLFPNWVLKNVMLDVLSDSSIVIER